MYNASRRIYRSAYMFYFFGLSGVGFPGLAPTRTGPAFPGGLPAGFAAAGLPAFGFVEYFSTLSRRCFGSGSVLGWHVGAGCPLRRRDSALTCSTRRGTPPTFGSGAFFGFTILANGSKGSGRVGNGASRRERKVRLDRHWVLRKVCVCVSGLADGAGCWRRQGGGADIAGGLPGRSAANSERRYHGRKSWRDPRSLRCRGRKVAVCKRDTRRWSNAFDAPVGEECTILALHPAGARV